MFTIGIFSTHIPYIAFVLFYAYFLIAGIQKASAGEIQISERSSFVSEMQVEQNVSDHSVSDNSFYYDSFLHPNLEVFVFKRKIKHRETLFMFHPPASFLTSFSNRPPPVAV